jgi:hypothetical protein
MVNKFTISTALLGFLIPSITYANMVWPALYTETKLSSVPIIGLSLVIEYFFFKWLFTINVRQAIRYTILANLISGLLGLFLRPIAGIAYELSLGGIINLLFNWGTFNPIAWIFVPILGGVINAFLELLTIRLIWKQKFNKRNYLFLWMINTVTIAIATIWVVIEGI